MKFRLFSHEKLFLWIQVWNLIQIDLAVTFKSSYSLIRFFSKLYLLSQIPSPNPNYKIKSHQFIFSTKFTKKTLEKKNIKDKPRKPSHLLFISVSPSLSRKWTHQRYPHIVPSSSRTVNHHQIRGHHNCHIISSLSLVSPPTTIISMTIIILLPFSSFDFDCESSSPTASTPPLFQDGTTPNVSLPHVWASGSCCPISVTER